MNKFEVQGVIGEGAYGTVLKCRNKQTGEIVAIKKFKDTDETSATQKTKIRELKLLRMLKQDFDGNIVTLLEAFRRHNKLYLVFEYCDNNVLEILENQPDGLAPEIVRKLVYQLLKAIEWCHRHDVIHRDIKPENLLVNRDFTMKLCDFGFARQMARKPNAVYTDYVATRWYRAPELLLGSTSYGLSVDVWAVGCIMGELTDGQPLFPGKTELDQLFLVQRMLGPLTKDQMEMFEQNPRFLGYKFPNFTRPSTVERRYLGKMEQSAISFMKDVFQMDPKNRPTAREALMHAYFDSIRPKDDAAIFMTPAAVPTAPSRLLELPMAYPPNPPSPADINMNINISNSRGLMSMSRQSSQTSVTGTGANVPMLNPPPGSGTTSGANQKGTGSNSNSSRQRGTVPRPDSAPRHIGDASDIRQYRAAAINEDAVIMPPLEGSSLPPPVPSIPIGDEDYDSSAKLIAAAQGRAQRRLREAARKQRQGVGDRDRGGKRTVVGFREKDRERDRDRDREYREDFGVGVSGSFPALASSSHGHFPSDDNISDDGNHGMRKDRSRDRDRDRERESRGGRVHHHRKRSNEHQSQNQSTQHKMGGGGGGYDVADSGSESDYGHGNSNSNQGQGQSHSSHGRASSNIGFQYLSIPDRTGPPSRSSSQTSGAGSSDERGPSKDGSNESSGQHLQPLTVSFQGAQAAPAGHQARPSMVRRAPRGQHQHPHQHQHQHQSRTVPAANPTPPVSSVSASTSMQMLSTNTAGGGGGVSGISGMSGDPDVFRTVDFRRRNPNANPNASSSQSRLPVVGAQRGNASVGVSSSRRRHKSQTSNDVAHPLVHLQIKGASGSGAGVGAGSLDIDDDSRRLLGSSGGRNRKAFGRSPYAYVPGMRSKGRS